MENEPITATMIYLLVSLAMFLVFRLVSKKISGPKLKYGVFWAFFVLLMLWGVVQLNVARYGYILFFPSTKDVVMDNYAIRWIAFVGALLQTICTPNKKQTTS